MPRPRLPVAKASLTGAALKNPGRHKGRADPQSDALGEPTGFLRGGAVTAWNLFKKAHPWLTEADRCAVEIASLIRGEMLDGRLPATPLLAQLRLLVASFGGTPADRSKITVPDEATQDPDDAFLN